MGSKGEQSKRPNAYEVPKATNTDRALTVVRAAVSAVPGVGGALAELADLVGTPLEKRRDAFAQQLADGLHRLEEKVAGFDTANLKDSPVFASTVAQAVQAVTRTHDAEKLKALRNAVLNTALGPPTGYDAGVLIAICETLTPWHLKILCFFEDPKRYFDAGRFAAMGRAQALEGAFPELRGQRALYDNIVRDLNQQGLLAIDSVHVTMTSRGAMASCLTVKGNALVQLIRSPLD